MKDALTKKSYHGTLTTISVVLVSLRYYYRFNSYLNYFLFVYILKVFSNFVVFCHFYGFLVVVFF